MTIGRRYRIFAGVLYPPLLGWGMPVIVGSIFYSKISLSMSFFLLFFAYFYMLIPSMIFSLSMEFIVSRFISNHFLAVGIAGSYGAICGFVLGTFWWQVGLVVGAIVGWHLRRNQQLSVNKSLKRTNNSWFLLLRR